MTYRLLDSGGGRKLEALGDVVVDRQAPQAVWRKQRPAADWDAADGRHVRSNEGGGRWRWRRRVPESWTIAFGETTLLIKPTPFGHCGLFAEQCGQWSWLRAGVADFAAREGRPPVLLNLFAYTGGSTLAAAAARARVTHVDAAQGVVDWARRNAELNGLAEAPVRWIVDDCRTFLRREVKRGAAYDGLVLDPPTFGRGRRREVWKIDEHLPELLELGATVTGGRPALLLLTGHTPGLTPIVLHHLLDDHFDLDDAAVDAGEMTVTCQGGGRDLPAGVFVRAQARVSGVGASR